MYGAKRGTSSLSWPWINRVKCASYQCTRRCWLRAPLPHLLYLSATAVQERASNLLLSEVILAKSSASWPE